MQLHDKKWLFSLTYKALVIIWILLIVALIATSILTNGNIPNILIFPFGLLIIIIGVHIIFFREEYIDKFIRQNKIYSTMSNRLGYSSDLFGAIGIISIILGFIFLYLSIFGT